MKLVPVLASAVGVLAVAPARADVTLSLAEAVSRARTHGFDARTADAIRTQTEGDVLSARAVQNPAVLLGWMHMWNYYPHDDPILGPCIQCANDGPMFQFMDQGLIENELTGKRALRLRVATATLRAATFATRDARRNLVATVEQQYIQVLIARRAATFAREIAAAATELLALDRTRYPAVIDAGTLARVESDKLTSDAAVLAADAATRQAEAALRFSLALAPEDGALVLDDHALDPRTPRALSVVTTDELRARALTRRPDLAGADEQRRGAEAALALEHRAVAPDISVGFNWLSAGYAQNTAAPPQLTLQVAFVLPLFDQHEGRIRRAEGAVRQAVVAADRARAEVVADVESALAAYEAARALVDLMEEHQLAAGRTARDITLAKYRAGAAPLTDYLDAERAFVAVHQGYLQALGAYWVAVFQLAQATALDVEAP